MLLIDADLWYLNIEPRNKDLEQAVESEPFCDLKIIINVH
jgi:hypothetical protein